MKTDIYILQVNHFVKFNGVYFAKSSGTESLSLHPSIERALDYKNEKAEVLKAKNYHIVSSGCGEDDPSLCFWSRYEDDQDRVVAFKIIKKTVEGDLFQYEKYGLCYTPHSGV